MQPRLAFNIAAFAPAVLGLCLGLAGISEAMAKKAPPKPAAPAADTAKPDTKGKPALVFSSGDWNVYVTQGEKKKTCYALAQPKERLPAALKRDPAFIFISTRLGENVKNEVSIIMGFSVKDGATTQAEIGDEAYDLLGKGTNAWVKNPAEEPKFVASLRKGSKLAVKMPSAKGNVTTDTYSLNGLGQALDRVGKECQ